MTTDAAAVETTPSWDAPAPLRISLIQCIQGFDDAALKFLLLSANSRQSTFEFEFLPVKDDDPLIIMLRQETTDRLEVEASFDSFFERYSKFVTARGKAYNLGAIQPTRIQLLTMASFTDNYYYVADSRVAVIALGQWRRELAPPSILEFFQTLSMKDAMWPAGWYTARSHLPTRGCVNDFSADLSEVRQKVLLGKVCGGCRESLGSAGREFVADDVEIILNRDWVGDSKNPASAAGIISNLGGNLFITKGLKPTWREIAQTKFFEKSGEQLATWLSVALLAIVVFFLGLLGFRTHYSQQSRPNIYVNVSPSPTVGNQSTPSSSPTAPR